MDGHQPRHMQSRARAVKTAATHTRSRLSAARMQPAEAGVSGRIIIRPYLLLRLESPGGLSSDFAHALGQRFLPREISFVGCKRDFSLRLKWQVTVCRLCTRPGSSKYNRADDLRRPQAKHWSGFGAFEHIPHAVLGQNVFGVCGVLFDFVTQVTHIDAQVFGLVTVLRSPHFAEQIGV